MANPILKITDGTTANTIDLLGVNAGMILNDWRPSIPNAKGGGVYMDSVMSDGRRMLMRRLENATETFNLRAHGGSQDTVITFVQKLLRILQKGTDYWENRWITTPVWIEARGSMETETRYALIHNYAIDNIDNPYAQPFFACEPGIATLNLAIERGHWMSTPPNEPLCVPIIGGDPNDIGTETVYVPGGSSDYYVRDDLGAGTLTFYLSSGLPLGTESDGTKDLFGIRFANLSIPQGARIPWAAIGLTLSTAHSVGNAHKVNVYIESSAKANVFSDLADWQRRSFSDPVEVTILGTAQSAGYTYVVGGDDTVKIAELLQLVVDDPDWEDGNNAVHFMFEIADTHVPDDLWQFAAYENVTYSEAYFDFDFSYQDADSDQCQSVGHLDYLTALQSTEAEIFVGSRWWGVGLTHIFRYDAGGPSYSANLLESTPPYNLFPSSPAVGDIIYFGSDQVESNGGAFFSLVFDPTAGLDWPGALPMKWQYYRGGSTADWQDFSGAGVFPDIVDRTLRLSGYPAGSFGIDQSIQRLRGRAVHWSSLHDTSGAGSWVETSVNGVSAYWIRGILLAAYTGGNVTVQSHPYAVTTPNIIINRSDVRGDMPARARLRLFYDGSDMAYQSLDIYACLVGMRTMYPFRDEEQGFIAFIPIQDTLDQPGVEYISTSYSYEDHAGATNGRILHVNPSGSGTIAGAHIVLKNSVYKGRFRAFVRAAVYNGTGSDTRMYLEIFNNYSGVKFTTRTVDIDEVATADDPKFKLLDFGNISLPVSNDNIAESNASFVYIYVETDSGTPDIYLESLILIPSDEWIGEVRIEDIGSTPYMNDPYQYLGFDSLSDFREDFIPVFGDGNASANVGHEAQRVIGKSVGEFIVPANTDVSFWVLPIGEPRTVPNLSSGAPQMTLKARLEIIERYFVMRGNR